MVSSADVSENRSDIFSSLREAPESLLIEGESGLWEVVIGMEVHAQIRSVSKLFSGAEASFGGAPNDYVSLVDAAFPGMLPVINAYCVEQAVRAGLGLRARINLYSVLDRKNYFYPDLPQGYQISQYSHPIVGAGCLFLDMDSDVYDDSENRIRIGIERLHIEQDAGKLLHDRSATSSYIDLNRAGVALMEIVSAPDLRSSAEARAYVTKLRMILRYLGVCDGDMEKGSLRADVNISVRRPGGALGRRCEIKNVNSFRFIGQAIDYEIGRQIGIIEDGGEIVQETRLFDSRRGETRSMRSKEEAHDYRYFPDPDLPPLILEQDWVDEIADSLPELPDEKKARFMEEYGLSSYDAGVLVAERSHADYYEEVVRGGGGRDAKLVANWVTGALFGVLNRLNLDIEEGPVSAASLGELLDMIGEGVISGTLARDVFEIMVADGGEPRVIVETRGLRQVTDYGAIESVVEEVMRANPKQVDLVRVKPKTLGWFTGQVMKAMQGKADPKRVQEILRRKLELD